MALHRIRHFNEELIAHRERIGRVEIDLLFRKKGGANVWTVIEVKSRFDDLWEYGPVSRRQSRRILGVVSVLRDQMAGAVHCHVAVVNHENRRYLTPRVRYFDLEASLY